jgi:SecD/SecF fusion protein
MSANLRWRIVLVVVVALFALALVWPTIRWATLSAERKQELNLLYYRWGAELDDDLAYTRMDDKQRQRLEAERAEKQKTLAADIAAYEKTDEYQKLPPFDQKKQLLKLESKARTPRIASLGRNIRHDLYRWWHGDEDKILRLGLDLQGGIYMVIETAGSRDEVYEKLKSRIDEFGVAEPILHTQGTNRIIIQLPGATDIEKAERLIKERAVMHWMLVEEDKLSELYDTKQLLNIYDTAVADLPDRGPDPDKPDDPNAVVAYKDADGNLINFKVLDNKLQEEGEIPVDTILRVYEDTDKLGNVIRRPLLLRSSASEPYVISGDDLRASRCRVTTGQFGEPLVAFEIEDPDARRRFKEITGRYSAESDNKRWDAAQQRYVGWRLAILLDNKVVSAPHIAQQLSGSGVITGLKDFDEASLLALQLRTGALPAEIKIVQNTQIGPTLGADSIRMGWRAAVIGLAVVIVFMAIYYRVSGVFAVVALVVNMVLLLGALAAAGATLTLPGIAGIILTIGMAVDANVLIFERIREELAAAKKVKAAVDAGYHKALRTILDANITTLITAAVLFFLGTGPVRGFAVTLSIGICTSVFCALVITRVLFDLLLLSKSVVTLKMFRFFDQPKVDFVGARRTAIAASIAVIVIGLVSFGLGGSDNFGIDFRGGTVYRLDFGNQEVRVGDVRAALAANGITDARVQQFDVAAGRVTKVMIQVRGTPEDDKRLQNLPDKIVATLNARGVGGSNPGLALVDKNVESISASLSAALGRQTLVAFLLALCGIMVYVSWRFEFRFAVGAIVALIHDVLITLGAFAGLFIMARRQINAPTIAAFLTIVGYSLNDTIVVFDRIREDLKIMKRLDFRTIINTSINQTLSRTLLTSLTTLLVILSLFVLGGQAINDFSFAMLVGVVVGTYSSIFIASPVLLLMERKAAA